MLSRPEERLTAVPLVDKNPLVTCLILKKKRPSPVTEVAALHLTRARSLIEFRLKRKPSSAFSGKTILLTATMINVVIIVIFRWLNF